MTQKENVAPKYQKGSACLVHRKLILKMWDAGGSVTAIAKKVKTHRRHVRNFLKLNRDYKSRPMSQPGEKSGNWKGGVAMDKGYRLLKRPDHPFANYLGYVREHRLVMENMIGRYLDPKEVVHHIDGDPLNNEPENLRLFSENSEHLKHELTGRVPKWTDEGKQRIREALLKKDTSAMREGYRRYVESRRAGIPFVKVRDGKPST